jgi:two-component system, NtrC family, response regulator AtoC
MLPVFRTLEKVLQSDTTVLIEGESGTGKDALAHWLHFNSTRKHGPYIKLDLGSLPEDLVESELFGYERGAFTGAHETKLGKLDLAQGGSIVIDEVASVDLRIQAKLLHVVEAKQFFRLGGSRAINLDSRIIALSGTPLSTAVERKAFRQDLFFRLNLINVRVPSLRERRNEVLILASRLLAQLDRKYSVSTRLAEECNPILLNYDFPGNIRELRNGLERAVLMSTNGRIIPGGLPPSWLVARGPGKTPSLQDVEREHIAQVLNQTRGKKTKAAEVLGISRKTLLEKRKKYGLE